MKKIIHLSDLHIGHKDLSSRFEEITNNIIFGKQPAKKYVIVITGDIVEDARLKNNYKQAKSHIEKLRAAGYRVLTAPGNHDYGTGNRADKKYAGAFWETFIKKGKVKYPNLDIIEKVAFIGLDSMAEELNWYDALSANGERGEEQLKRLDVMLGSKRVRDCARRVVYLHHHPFDPQLLHELKDSEELGETLRKHGNVDALLYGHNHAGRKRNGMWGIPRCYDGGTATLKEDGVGHHRVMDLTRDARLDYDGDFHGSTYQS
jgi:3',5'-cyclic AMP phosphodiesterase CpdA